MALVRHTGRSLKNKRFNSSNNLPIIRIDTYRAPEVRYLVVAGGGGGGENCGGGGGAGGYLHSNLITGNKSFVISVGAGGQGAPAQPLAGTNGNPSGIRFYGPPTNNDVVAYGGGGGGGFGGQGSPGGSGGAGHQPNTPGGSNVYLQGQPGEHGWGSFGGGGGGAGEAGGTRGVLQGGNGLYNNISGANIAYAGGGSGGVYPVGSPANAGGVGGGGQGGARLFGGTANLATSGNVNTGGGGGSNGYDAANPSPTNAAGAGGSGIVILSHSNTYANATVTGSPNVTYANGNVIYRFWQSGTIDFTPIVGFTNL